MGHGYSGGGTPEGTKGPLRKEEVRRSDVTRDGDDQGRCVTKHDREPTCRVEGILHHFRRNGSEEYE